MSEEWEYVEEAIQAQSEKDYFDSCPKICQSCRWLDTYYRFGCTQLAYPDTKDKCILYIHHKWFKRLWLWKKFDLSYYFWKVRVWFYQRILRRRANIVGSWRQWEYSDYEEDYENW